VVSLEERFRWEFLENSADIRSAHVYRPSDSIGSLRSINVTPQKRITRIRGVTKLSGAHPAREPICRDGWLGCDNRLERSVWLVEWVIGYLEAASGEPPRPVAIDKPPANRDQSINPQASQRLGDEHARVVNEWALNTRR
jgi:hypothetical protein